MEVLFLASELLKNRINGFENYILTVGIDEVVIEEYIKASKVALNEEKDIKYGLKVSNRAKEIIRQYIINISTHDFEWLEEYSQQNNVQYDIIDKYYEVLAVESEFLLDSYALYIEKDRPKRERFYEPRRKTLKKVVDKLQALEDDELDELFVHMPARVGKLMADDTLVWTSNGWKKHGDLVVGDMVVGSDGLYTKVIQIHPKHHTTHTVTLTDGSKYECHENHEWTVYDRAIKAYRTMETREIAKRTLCSGGHYMFKLPLRPVVEGEYQEFSLPPYVLGAWLGDGTNQKPCLTLDKKDKGIALKCERLGFPIQRTHIHKDTGVETHDFGRRLSDELHKYNMCFRSHRTEKYIPEEYLKADANQRLQLLAGLLDTDGTLVLKERRYRYSTTSERLKDDFIQLINSFGWRVSVTKYEPKLSSSGIQGRLPVYTIGFNPNLHIRCVLSRKQLYEFSSQRHISIKSIEESEHKQGNCITVENADGLYAIGKNMHLTHNSQMMTIYMAWHCARNTEYANLYCTYKESLGGAFLEGVIEIWTDPTYCHNDIFPKAKIVYTDSKNHKVDLERRKKYKSLAGKGLESGLNGEYDAKGVLVIDDIIEGIQDVLNPDTLRRKQIVFDNNLMSRAKEQCKIVYNGTIWSLHDIYMNRLDFLQNNPKATHIRWEILKIPALDPETDESNFDYDYGVGFSSEYYKTKRAKFEENDDLASWYAQYQQEPIERDGAVFNPESMRFYNGILPSEEPLKVMSACDVALGGGDYLSMPVAYVYENGDCYIHDVVFDNQEKDKTQPQVINAIINNKITSGFFESNQGGEGYKDDIDRQLKEMNYKISLISKYAPTKTRKEQRIWDNAPTIRQFIFRDVGCRSPQYRKFMTNLYSFTINGKNKNDDAADSLSQLADFMKSGASIARVEVIANPFRTGGYGSYGNF